MENIRKSYLPIVHFVSLGLLIFLLASSPWRTVEIRTYKEGIWDKQGWKEGDIVISPSKYEMGKISDYSAVSMYRFNTQYAGQNAAGSEGLLSWDLKHYDLRNSAERQNRALIVYTLLAMYLGSGYLLFKKS